MDLKRLFPFFGRQAQPDPRADDLARLAQATDRLTADVSGLRDDLAGLANRSKAMEGQGVEVLGGQRQVLRALDELAQATARRLLLELVALDVDRRHVENATDEAQQLEGYRMLAARLVEVLEREGVEALDVAGAPYDPAWHEALGRRKGAPAGLIAQVFAPAYHLAGQDRPLVRAKVVVGDGVPTP